MINKLLSLFRIKQKKDFSLEIGFKNDFDRDNKANQINNSFDHINIKDVYDIIKKEIHNLKKENDYMRKYLVVLDTTNRPEVKDKGLAGGLKNFYFVFAQDINEAKVKVLSTFARTPHIVEQIQYSLSVTPIEDILNVLGPELQLWSYIPFSRSQRFPGQKSVPPGQNLNPVNRDEIIPIKPEDIPKPITPPSKNDIDSKLLDEAPKSKNQNVHSNEQNTIDLLKKLIYLLENNKQNENLLSTVINNLNNKPNNNSINDQNDNINLQQKIVENLENSRPRHINADNDPNFFIEEELKAKQEVENFKNLPPQELEKIQQNILQSIIKDK